jgi:hypothetical protein
MHLSLFSFIAALNPALPSLLENVRLRVPAWDFLTLSVSFSTRCACAANVAAAAKHLNIFTIGAVSVNHIDEYNYLLKIVKSICS